MAWRLLRRLPVSSLVTQRISSVKAQEAVEMLDKRPEEAVQVLLVWKH